MNEQLLKISLDLNFITYFDKSIVLQNLHDSMEELRSIREHTEHGSPEEIYLRCLIAGIKQMIDKKTYTIENVRYISGKILEFLNDSSSNDGESSSYTDDSDTGSLKKGDST